MRFIFHEVCFVRVNNNNGNDKKMRRKIDT